MNTKLKIFIIAIIFIFNSISVHAVEKSHLDTIILLDTSGSMKASDKTKIAIEAVKMYIDMAATGSRIGVIAFNDEITANVALTEITSQNDKNILKEKISYLDYQGYTDIGMSLESGVKELNKLIKTTSNPLIILFTDGQIEIDEAKYETRSVQDSLADVHSVLNDVANKIPIYTVGLNYNDSVDKELLKTISDATSARNYITDSAANLPQIFNEIFADFIKSTLVDAGVYVMDGQNSETVKINIPNSVVSEANIIMLSSSKIIDVSLVDPNGVNKNFNVDNISYTSSTKYSMIKILNPIEGEWFLQMNGLKGDEIKVNLIYSFDLDLHMTTTQQADSINIIGKLFKDGKSLDDPILYEGLTGTIVLESKDGSKQEFNLDNNKTEFIGSVSEKNIAALNNDANLYIKVVGKDYNRVSEKLEIKAAVTQPAPPLIKTQPPEEQKEIQEPQISNKVNTSLLFLMLAFICLLLSFVFYMHKKNKNIPLNGTMEICIVDENGIYLPLEVSSLRTFIGVVKIDDIISSTLNTKFKNKIEELLPVLKNITIKQRLYNNNAILILDNHSDIKITEPNEETIINNKKYHWINDKKIVIQNPNKKTRIELTYKSES